MIYSCLISLCLFGFGGADIVTSSITVLDSYGIQLTSPAAIEENNQIDFRCTATYSQTGTEWTNNLNLINNSVTDLQLRCFGKSDTTADEKYISTDGFLIPNSQSCLYNQLSARFQIGSEPSLTLQCSWSSFTGPYVKIDEFDIQTYASPSKPTVTQTLPSSVNTPKVGDDVTYTCTSTARPPPKLRFSFSKRVIRASELTHTPAIVNITDDSAEATSTLTWTTKATSDMHGEYLFCQVYDHMSGLMESNELRMKVYFGPLPHTDVDLQWNLASVSTLNINCSLECHGCVSYEWYTGSVLPENKLSQTGKTLPIENTVFIHISGFDEEIITYICRSFNTHTNLTTTLETNVKVYSK
ncbi:hypothetical protein EB796_013220 [Bugula neritina]|uniref:Ig-like domain-containing protein n=1 Tax=Bugula neritina TaxID=10212 RepID=A0A7J7JQ28_BUGNE|nr:hypothetical protein EB796_013220 [Bugula neritina]